MENLTKTLSSMSCRLIGRLINVDKGKIISPMKAGFGV